MFNPKLCGPKLLNTHKYLNSTSRVTNRLFDLLNMKTEVATNLYGKNRFVVGSSKEVDNIVVYLKEKLGNRKLRQLESVWFGKDEFKPKNISWLKKKPVEHLNIKLRDLENYTSNKVTEYLNFILEENRAGEEAGGELLDGDIDDGEKKVDALIDEMFKYGNHDLLGEEDDDFDLDKLFVGMDEF